MEISDDDDDYVTDRGDSIEAVVASAVLTLTTHQTRVQSLFSRAHVEAAGVLSQLAQRGNRERNAIREGGGLAALVSRLNTSANVTAGCATALSHCAFDNDANCDAIRTDGGIAALVASLKAYNADQRHRHVRLCVVSALANLAMNEGNRQAFSDQYHGRVRLSQLLRKERCPRVLYQVLRAIANFALHAGARDAFVGRQCVSHVMHCVRHTKHDAMLDRALTALANLCSSSYAGGKACTAKGLRTLCQCVASPKDSVRRHACAVLAFAIPQHLNIVRANGRVLPLLLSRLLEDDSQGVVYEAARAFNAFTSRRTTEGRSVLDDSDAAASPKSPARALRRGRRSSTGVRLENDVYADDLGTPEVIAAVPTSEARYERCLGRSQQACTMLMDVGCLAPFVSVVVDRRDVMNEAKAHVLAAMASIAAWHAEAFVPHAGALVRLVNTAATPACRLQCVRLVRNVCVRSADCASQVMLADGAETLVDCLSRQEPRIRVLAAVTLEHVAHRVADSGRRVRALGGLAELERCSRSAYAPLAAAAQSALDALERV